MENNKTKAIYISEENHKKIMHLKFEHSFKNINQTIGYLLKLKSDKKRS